MKPGDELRATVLAFIKRDFNEPADGARFNELALSAFKHQFEENEPYRRYCERRGVSPESPERWAEIPAVPTAAFKEAALICGTADDAKIVFRTSGTTHGVGKRGAHYVRDLSLYRAAVLPNFQRHLIPDRVKLPMLILGEPPGSAPESSLAWMLDLVMAEYGADDSGYYGDAGGLAVDALIDVLAESENGAKPVCLLGTAAAFAHLIEKLVECRRSFRVPPGSRIMETGGFKRRSKEMSRPVFYESLVSSFGVSPFYCVAEYGMTEMCSQFYDNVLAERALGRSPRQRSKIVPPWVRTQVVDAETLQPLLQGELGLLKHFDLANLESVCAIQTDDLGVTCANGFEIFGRAAGAELRGCSIAVDEWLAAQR